MKLGNLINVINGYAFDSKLMTSNQNNIPVIKIKELKNNLIKITNDTLYHKYSDDLEKFILKKGDIVVSLTGNPPGKGGFDAIVGRTAKYNYPFPAYMNQRLCKIGLKSNKLLNKYLFYLLSYEKTTIKLASCCTGSANQANISSKDILNLSIDLPDIEIQQHIVNTISLLLIFL